MKSSFSARRLTRVDFPAPMLPARTMYFFMMLLSVGSSSGVSPIWGLATIRRGKFHHEGNPGKRRDESRVDRPFFLPEVGGIEGNDSRAEKSSIKGGMEPNIACMVFAPMKRLFSFPGERWHLPAEGECGFTRFCRASSRIRRGGQIEGGLTG